MHTTMHTVTLIQAPYIDGALEAPYYTAAGYLVDEDVTAESGPTVRVRWAGDDGDGIDWDHPTSITHYQLGVIEATVAPPRNNAYQPEDHDHA